MGRHTDSTTGAHSRADAAPATTHEREVTSTTGRAQGHAPARPPFRLGDTVRHHHWGTGTVVLPLPVSAEPRWRGWWVTVQFDGHRTACLSTILEAEA